MYADRYANRRGLDPVGATLALGVSGLVAFGLTLATPNITRQIETVLTGVNIPLPTDPPPIEKPKPKPPIEDAKPVQSRQRDPIDMTRQTVTVASGADSGVHIDVPPPDTVTAGTGSDIGTIIPPHVAVLRDPTLDSRYIDSFQPNYPSDMRLGEREGRVVVRVLIGADGRVKDVQQISAASTSFFEATRKQALTKWRFKPGTKDGVAIEAWHTMAVRFVLDEG